MEEQPYQSLYRRYRPQRFAEVRGQDHVAAALRNAVRRDHVSHAYLFSGPRGTGKTSTARILAKALNCEATEDGEPCGRCESCISITKGSSLDVHELDAASNNGVDAMRDLVSRSALATPGRHKIYIIDEVHMLSTPASNTLLKTLEEPPPHVVFVLATTDPHKVLQTIVSRTQHFEFHLLAADVLAGLLRDVQSDAGLGLAPGVLSLALKRANGSARDALSALDQLVAAEGSPDEDEVVAVDDLMEALSGRDAPGALLAVARGVAAGRDPARLTTELVERLRQGFLARLAPSLVELGDDERAKVAAQAEELGTAGVVRAMEALGQALVEMRDSLDPRVSLEVVLVRLASPESDISSPALLERIERLENRLGQGNLQHAPLLPAPPVHPVPATPVQPAPAPTVSAVGAPTAATDAEPVPVPPAAGTGTGAPGTGAPAAGARAALHALRAPGPALRTPPSRLAAPPPLPGAAPQPGQPAPEGQTTPPLATGPAPPTRDDLVEAWGDHVLATLRPRARSLFRAGRFVEATGGVAVFALPDAMHRANCEQVRADVEAALSAHFAAHVRLRLVVDESHGGDHHSTRTQAVIPGSATTEDELGQADDEVEDLPASEVHGLAEADIDPISAAGLLMEAFPGAEWIKAE